MTELLLALFLLIGFAGGLALGLTLRGVAKSAQHDPRRPNGTRHPAARRYGR